MRGAVFALVLSTATANPVAHAPNPIIASKISALECKIINVVVNALKAAPSATKYCSSILGVVPTTKLVTVTSTQTDLTTQVTGTATVTAETVTITTTLPTEVTTCLPEAIEPTPEPTPAAAALNPRAINCAGAPKGMQQFKCDQVTKACKCISIPTPTSTKTSTVAAATTKTVNSITTTTFTPIATATTYSTSTALFCPPPQCTSPSQLCGSACLPVDRDPNNCGSCGNVCASGVCKNGICLNNNCAGQTCDTFESCGAGGSCVCASVSGGGLCADGQTPCNGLTRCTADNDCPQGRLCALNTCCDGGVCIGTNNDCQNRAAPKLLFARRRARGQTVGGF